MTKLKKLFSNIWNLKTFFEVFRYGLVTLTSYFFLLICIFLLSTYINIGEKISYAIALTINYFGVYIGYNKFVFKTTHNPAMLKRFIVVLICSWVANNIFFTIWLDVFSLHYSIAVILNTAVLGVFRFLAQKFYVRK